MSKHSIGWAPKAKRHIGRSMALFSSLVLVLVVPLVLTVLWSLTKRWSAPHLWPEQFSLDIWREVMGDGEVMHALVRSTLIAVCVTCLSAIMAFPTAWAMAKKPLRYKRAIEMLILAPAIVPGIVVAVGISQLFLVLHLAYSNTGVILVQLIGTLPLMIRLLTASFETFPDELLHAARSLGASQWRAIWFVVMPLTVPSLMAGGLLSFIGSFEEFDKTFIVGAPVVQTLPILLYQHLDPYSMQLPVASVVALVLLLPVFLVFLLSGRFIRDDLMAGGMGKV